ncbi:cytochrome P450 2A1-like [Schistocerca serialis cubense]|uniref:cytochrome P450 2A1-like n=1 Tax=Schistocerca serialis cubense TaxID=2023355 RepID=UPI00214E64ED|nr:cytochrome P450 2A1-like [Schistocerca serialis cubense]
MRQLRSLGFSGAAMQAQVGKEVRALLDVLSNSRGRPTQLNKLLAPSVLNVILQFCAESQLLMLFYDMFTAGAEMTSNSLRFAFLVMLRHPDVQERVHKETKEAVGTDRLPTHEDKDRYLDQLYTDELMGENC